MLEKVTAYIEQHHMIQKGDHICVGVSGGADSVCLFRILELLQEKMGFTMSVAHIEHGIRGEESLQDMEFVEQLTKAYKVTLTTYSYPVIEIAKREGISVEEAGRNVRYEAFAKEAEKYMEEAIARGGNVKIALAHHGDDSAETMLFHMCRGSGVDGLVGIRPTRDTIIRPLLCVTREEIENYLKENSQSYQVDATNADVNYSRNRIRNHVMPELTKVNEQTVSHMNALAEDIREISEYLYEEVDKILKVYRKKKDSGEIEFAVEGLWEYPPVLQKRVMLELIAEVSGSRKDIGREHTKALLELAAGQVGRRISLPYGILAEKTYGAILLYKTKRKEDIIENIPLKIAEEMLTGNDVQGELILPIGKIAYRVFHQKENYTEFPENQYTKWFDYDKIKDGVCVRNRAQGDYLIVDSRGYSKKIKDYFINEKVPRTKRNQILLLADGSHILWIVGYRISEYYKVTEQTRRVLEVQFMEGLL